ncbi:MAG: NupC/NupG family nucleoside CNT transporter [Akkermansiaceae bacterium]
MERWISVLGVVIILGIAFAFSENRRAIQWRTVGGAFAVQVLIAAWVLGSESGQVVLQFLTDGVQQLLLAGQEGIEFVFGDLARQKAVGFVFAFRVLPVIIFFSSLIAVLYYLKIMQLVIRFLGGGLHQLLGTSRTESFSAAANVFVGQTEAPLVVKPYLPTMTKSELFAVMVGGLASIAGSVLAGYASMGARMDHLLAACFMAAPAGLLFAKIIKPETDVPQDGRIDLSKGEDQPVNVFDAAALGASNGLKLALNVGAMLLAFVGLIAVLNLFLGMVGAWFDYEGLSFQKILGWAFAPVAWILGVSAHEIQQVGSLIGQKIILNEFYAFKGLQGLGLSPRSTGIATFALCGFANLSSIAILLGGLGVMAPHRRQEIARFGLKAVFAATLANLASAALAGVFLS